MSEASIDQLAEEKAHEILLRMTSHARYSDWNGIPRASLAETIKKGLIEFLTKNAGENND